MKNLSLLIVILLTSFVERESILIKGKTVYKDTKDVISGVEIHFPNEGIKTVSDAEGNFQITVPREGKYTTITFDYYDVLPAIHLTSVNSEGKDTLNLGYIEMINNKVIDVAEVEKYKHKSPQKIKPIYHWLNLLGYSLTDEVEADDLVSTCKDKLGNPYHYQYDSEKNIIKIDYQRIKECL